jgi:ABC-type glycerol-3-phosphate transport system permease component
MNPAARAAIGNVAIPTLGVRLATAMISIGPIVLLYPLLQKYFIKGIMIGSVKG